MSDFLQGLFTADNRFVLDKIRGVSPYPAPLQTHLERMVQRIEKGNPPYIVPRVTAEKEVVLYVVGKNHEQSEELRHLVRNSIGNAYTQTEASLLTSSEDAIECHILRTFPHGIRKVSFPPEINSDRKKVYWVMGVLNYIVEEFARRPVDLSPQVRPVGRILRDITSAIYLADAHAAQEHLDELRARGLLSAINLLFLQIQINAIAGSWSEILNHSHIHDLAQQRIPRGIARVLLQATQKLVLPSLEPGEIDIEVARGLLNPLAPIFLREPDLSAEGDKDLEEWKVWVLGASALGNFDALSQAPDGLSHKWRTSVAVWCGRADVVSPSEPSLADLLANEPTIENAAQMLEYERDASEHQFKTILKRIYDYPTGIKQELFSNPLLRRFRDPVERQGGAVAIGSWPDWFDVLQSEKPDVDLLRVVLSESEYWNSSSWDEAQLVSIIDAGESAIVSVLRDAVPSIMTWLDANDLKLRGSTIDSLLLSFATDSLNSIQDIALCNELFSRLLEIPHSSADYVSGLESLQECWRKVESPSALMEVFELFDMLIDFPCSDASSREKFWLDVQTYIISVWSRLAVDVRLLARNISTELIGDADPFPGTHTGRDDESEDITPDVTGKSLGIYTLTESAGRRASSVLCEMFPSLKILTNHDKNATSALSNLALTADYFIFASRSAAHAAFDEVQRKRKEIIYPAGKGSSSIVRAFLSAIQ